MNTKYVVFKRKINSNRTIFPRQAQSGSIARFFVNERFVKLFPKKELGWKNIQVADLVFVDGVLIKNRFGPVS